MGGKILGLLRRFLSLLWRWGWVWLGFELVGSKETCEGLCCSGILAESLLYSAGAMVRDVDAQPMGFWGLWYPSMVGVVAGRGDFEVEVVDLGGGGCDCAVVMAVVEVAD
jgi:hypothetical protein